MFKIITTTTSSFSTQVPGTSGLRKKTKEFMQTNYTANYVQSICNALNLTKGKILIASDGRFYSNTAINIQLSILIANDVSEIYIPINGIMPTPAASNFIIKNKLHFAILNTASHNKGGIDYDFGIKIDNHLGAPINDNDNAKIVNETNKITFFNSIDIAKVDLKKETTIIINNTKIIVFNPTTLYTKTMKGIFDFDAISSLLKSDFKFKFNALYGSTGTLAEDIFINALGMPKDILVNHIPNENFGGLTPDPNPTTVKDFINSSISQGINFGACCDSDGDRNFIFTNKHNLMASDQLALITLYSKTVPFFKNIKGIARSFATPAAVDLIANKININTYITPVGWKFFSNLLNTKHISLCGEESFGVGGNYINEKDGLFGILFILHIMVTTKLSLNDLLENMWKEFGRWFFSRLDFENLDNDIAETFINSIHINSKLQNITSEEFNYHDITNNTLTTNCGIIYNLNSDNKIIIRKSGTSTNKTTIRVYLHSYTKDYNDSSGIKQLSDALYALANLDIKASFII